MPLKDLLPKALRALCGAAAIGIMVMLSDMTATPLVWIPFASSIVMVLGSPEAHAARPQRLIGGHLVCAASGILCTMLLGFDPWVAAVAIFPAMLVMQLLDVFHPPAAASPIVIVTAQADPAFILSPILAGALLLVAFSRVCVLLESNERRY